MDMSLSAFQEMLKDREGWRATVHRVAESWTWLSNWTTIKWVLEGTERKDISSTCSWYCLLLEKSGSLWLVVKTGRGFPEFRGRSHQLQTAVEKLLQHMNSGCRVWKQDQVSMFSALQACQVRCTWANADGTCGIWINIFFAHSLNCLIFTKALNCTESKIKSL